MARAKEPKATTTKTGRNTTDAGNGKNVTARTTNVTTTNILGSPLRTINPDERNRMIREAAYFRALKRGFKNGDPLQDWVAAEREIDGWLKSRERDNRPRAS